jgi:excisionase family DNA binding protein
MVIGFGEAWAMKMLEDDAVDDRLLTAEEVAALLRVTWSWVYAETRRDGLPHLRLGRYVLYRRSGIERWLEERERGPRFDEAVAATSSRWTRVRPARTG